MECFGDNWRNITDQGDDMLMHIVQDYQILDFNYMM